MIPGPVRRAVPDGLKRALKHSPLYLKHRSSAVNVYHCCVQKTASRWVRKILMDRRVFRHCGLDAYDFHRRGDGGVDTRIPTEIRVSEPLPPRTIATPLYLDFEGYRSIPKPDRYRAFFVMRDPRDIVVSWYFSMRNSHPTMDGVLTSLREELRSKPREEGLKTAIDRLDNEAGLFEALRSWASADRHEPDLIFVRYEDLIGDEAVDEFGRLMDHCDIGLPKAELEAILDEYSFRRMSGRRRGDEDVDAHLRKGVAGDWINHFTDDVAAYFRSVAGDLVADLGYRGGDNDPTASTDRPAQPSGGSDPSRPPS